MVRVLSSDFKLLSGSELIKNYDDGSVELYDLSADLSETKNIAAENPKVATELTKRLDDWLRSAKAALPRR